MNEKENYPNILVNALVNLGDIILITSAIALLKKAYPKSKITVLVKPAVCQAVENNPVIDEVIVFNYRPKQNSISQTFRILKDIKKRRFDLNISFDRKLRPALLCWLADIPIRIGPDRVFEDKRNHVTWFYTKVIPIRCDLYNTLQAEIYQDIVRGFTGIKERSKPVFSRIMPENEQNAKKLLDELPEAEKYIALCVKGTHPMKTWPREYFVELVDTLNKYYNASFFIVGAQNDIVYADKVIELMHTSVANFCGRTSLIDLAALMKKSDLLVTVDTGAAHIAATTKIPMVVVYGCTSPKRWHPINKNAYVFSSYEHCLPPNCLGRKCPSNPNPNCLWRVKPEAVLEQCKKILG